MEITTFLAWVFAPLGVLAVALFIYTFFHVQGLRYTQECQCPKCGDQHWCAPDDEIEIKKDELIA